MEILRSFLIDKYHYNKGIWERDFIFFPIYIKQDTEDIPNSELHQGDSWFSSVMTFYYMVKLGHRLKGVVKTSHSIFPKIFWKR